MAVNFALIIACNKICDIYCTHFKSIRLYKLPILYTFSITYYIYIYKVHLIYYVDGITFDTYS